MKGLGRVRVFVVVGLFLCTPLIWAQTATEDEGGPGYVCFPDAAGAGWVCEQNRGQAPKRKATPPPKTEGETEAVLEATEIPPSNAELERSAPIDPPVQEDAPLANPEQTAEPLSTAAQTLAIVNATAGTGPDDWYKETPPRPLDAEHALHEDVAAVYFRENELAGQCGSGYVVRDYPHAISTNNEEFPIHVEADQLQAQMDVSARFDGNVSIQQGNRFIAAPAADVEYDSRIAQFPQGVRMDQPGVIMQGDSAVVHLNTKQADLEGVQFVLTDAGLRGESQVLAQSEDGDLALTDTEFTRCHPGNNGWRLNADSLVIEEDEVFGTAKGAVLRMKGIPVFYSPYLKFPVSDERVSGFLFPNLSYSDEDGTEVSIPYYLNLAPNYDATVVPRYMSERGAGLELELRHLSGWQNTTLSGALLPEDDIFNGLIDREDFDEAGGEPVLGPFEPADRWLVAMDHDGRIGPFQTIVDYTSVSDADYFRDLGSDLGVSSQVELERRGEIRYRRGDFFARLWAQRFQRLDIVGVEEYQRLPELDMSYQTELFGPLEFSVDAQIAEFDRDTDGLNGFAAVTGRRTHVEPRIRIPLARSWGFLNITGALKHTSYDLEQDRAAGGLQLLDDNPDRSIGMGSVDAGLFFERDLDWFNTPLIQTLEPRVYYLYQQFEDQTGLPVFDASELTFSYSQLFRENRFSGIDRIGDADQVSVGVTTRFVSRDSGREFFRASIGEIYYLQDREVRLSGVPTIEEMRDTSAIATEMSAQLFTNWRITGSLVYDHHNGRTQEGGAAIQYRRDNRHIINVGFRRQVRSNVEQTDISVYWPLTERIALIGRWNQDLVTKRTIEGFGGLEYSDCCLQVRLMARRFLDSRSGSNFADIEGDDGIFLQIVFKGLAGFGNKVESVLERGIRGYRAPDGMSYFAN